MINAISQQNIPNFGHVGFNSSSNIQNTNIKNNSGYTPQEKKIINRSAISGAIFYGGLGTIAVTILNNLQKEEELIPGSGINLLSTKSKVIGTIIGGLFLATVGAIVNSIQTKRAINLMHSVSDKQNNQQ